MTEAIEELLRRFGDHVQAWTQVSPNEVRVTVSPSVWREVAHYLRDAPQWQMDYPADLTVWDTGSEFWVYLRLWSSLYNHNVIVLTAISREEPRIASLATLYPGVDWHEREMYDMYGVLFEGHPNLKRILLPDDWEGFPFRKDYVAVPSGNPLHGPQPVD
ncbi:MAG: NADH-quinone oxidoreductase subunit C [Armatimonadetes bacterium]|nr:NADH-quinone oxidoreductase subunit C [Armatimonadota bacterium]